MKTDKKIMRPLAEKIVRWQDAHTSMEGRRKIQKTYAEIYVGEDAELKAFSERVKLTEKLLKAMLAAILLALLAGASTFITDGRVKGNRIQRPADLENIEVSLDWEADNADGTLGGSLNLIVNGVPLDGADLEALFAYGEEYIHGLVPENTPIKGDLDFVNKIPKTGLSVRWKPENYLYVLPDGSRTEAEIPEEGVKVSINVELTAHGEKHELTVQPVLARPEATEKSFAEKLKELVREIEATSIGAFVELPEEVDGVRLRWKESRSNSLASVALIGLALIAGVLVHDYETKKKQIKDREREMLRDYPEIVSKLLLLLEAGLTIHSAWERIVLDYRSCGEKRFAYEEMCITFREMENGISDVTACEGFGQRCRLLPYLRFSNLLVQNLTKGAKSVLALLEQEAINAFEDRKEMAKKQGEEVGTKLLLPMIGLLVIILAMIMLPAFQNI